MSQTPPADPQGKVFVATGAVQHTEATREPWHPALLSLRWRMF